MDKVFEISQSSGKLKSRLLEQVLEEHADKLDSSWDYFVFVLHALVLETGLTLHKNTVCKKSNYYHFEYQLPGRACLTHCSLNVHRLGPMTSIIGNFHGDPVESYVLNKTKISEIIQPSTCDILNLRQISQEFKDKVSLPLLVKMQQAHDVEPRTVLILPDEMLVSIAEKLSDVSTIRSFNQTCQRFKSISSHPLLWKALLKKYFPAKYHEHKNDIESNWRSLFKAALLEKRAQTIAADLVEGRYEYPFGIFHVWNNALVPYVPYEEV